MTITIEVPEAVVREAEVRGIAVETLVGERLGQGAREADSVPAGFTRFGPGMKTPAEAAASMRVNRERYTLGDVTIKQLIEEGRRY